MPVNHYPSFSTSWRGLRMPALVIVLTVFLLAGCSALGGRQPAQPDVAAGGAPTAVSQAKPAAASAATECRKVRSRDGSFEGCVFGVPPKGAKFSQLYIGMTEYQARKLLGHPQDTQHITNWRKAWIPFYHGSDARRVVWLYEGQGSISFDAGGSFANGGVIVEIRYDPKIEL